MPVGISLHLGLNAVDSAHYGSPLPLSGCHNDARDMGAIAQATGFRSRICLDAEATAPAVIAAINDAARTLRPGDTFLLTYAGHGAQVPDESGDESDALDETWVLFDRMLLDDELYAALSAFSGGVRVLLISDSCHSGSVARTATYRQLAGASPVASQYVGANCFFRTPSESGFGQRVLRQHASQYQALTREIPPNPRERVRAAVIQLSGCQDEQLSADGQGNGLFTSNLKEVWSSGQFRGSHRAFWQHIGRTMPPSQSPGYLTFGEGMSDFENERPFTISPIAPMADNTPTGNNTMNTQQSNEGNWAEVRAELKRLFPALDLSTVESDAHSVKVDGGSVIASPTEEAQSHASSTAQRAATGNPIVRTYFWGFNIEVSSQNVRDFLSVAEPLNAIAASIGPVTGPAAPFIMGAAVFVAGSLRLMKALDQGNGVYISMSWFAPGVFIPTTVPGRREIATRGPGDAYEVGGYYPPRNYTGGMFGLRLEDDIFWNLPDGTERESVVVNMNPPEFGNVYFNGWLDPVDPTVGHFRLHVGVGSFRGGQVVLRMLVRDAAGRRSVVSKSVPGPRPLTAEEL
ncbi:caspase family protein [Myxococcus sp. RHSTA-1-4]|uniref:caspase family protein n=1 Tax=Myxococcus sp. RHSTA-1-4 TaxID=2874601 RepID=UPI001CBF9FE3|nr:caspase family protein [Myxococcus sp. RHSTA-1-4]MBZ4422374.1 caspase family protein [Myxococcus sp. RHSTA-1-4]